MGLQALQRKHGASSSQFRAAQAATLSAVERIDQLLAERHSNRWGHFCSARTACGMRGQWCVVVKALAVSGICVEICMDAWGMGGRCGCKKCLALVYWQ